MTNTLFPSSWGTQTAYSVGDMVTYSGIVYENIVEVLAATGDDINDIPFDNSSWKFSHIRSLDNYYAIIEAVKLEINKDDDMINRSIPSFIERAELSVGTRIRSPRQRKTVLVTADSQGRVVVPSDLIQVINLSFDSSTSSRSTSLSARGQVEILAGNIEEFKELENYYSGDGDFIPTNIPFKYEAPVYWFDATRFHIAPSVEAKDRVIEIVYYSSVPALGREYPEIDSDGDPIDANGDKTEDSGLPQNMLFLINNIFTDSAPHMIMYGALLNAETALKDDPRIPLWKERFQEAEAEFIDEITRFEEYRAHTFQMNSAYA